MANTSIRGTSSDGSHVTVGSNAYIIKPLSVIVTKSDALESVSWIMEKTKPALFSRIIGK